MMDWTARLSQAFDDGIRTESLERATGAAMGRIIASVVAFFDAHLQAGDAEYRARAIALLRAIEEDVKEQRLAYERGEISATGQELRAGQPPV
jgi:hypothetical protein